MFNAKGLIQSMGIVLLTTIAFSIVIGLFNIGNVPSLIIVQFFFTHLLIGLIAPLKNEKAPFTAAFIGSVTLSVINYFFAYYVFTIYVLADPQQLNQNLVLSTSIALGTAFISKNIMDRKIGKPYA